MRIERESVRPALVVIGGHDMMTPPKAAAALVKALLAATTVTIPPSGHSLMAEAPDATLDALIRFLAPLAQGK